MTAAPASSSRMLIPESGRLRRHSSEGSEEPSPGGGSAEILEPAVIENRYLALLSEYPEAPVAAVMGDGLFVDMPASFPLAEHPQLRGRSGLDLVIPEDRGSVIEAWDAMLGRGIGRCVVHLAVDPSQTVAVELFDARATHGVCLHVITPGGSANVDVPARRREIAGVMPRFATMRKNQRGIVLEVDEATTQILGWEADELVGRRTLAFTHPDDHAVVIENWMDLLAAPGPTRRVRVRYQRRDESWVWFEITNHNLLDDPDHHCVVSGMLDISEEMAANEALRAREQLLDRLAEALPMGLFQIDSARHVVYTNDRFHEIVGTAKAHTVRSQLSSVVARDRPALADALDAVLGRGLAADIEVELKLPRVALPRLCTMNFRALSDDAGTVNGAIVCVADVTEAASMREELKHRATFDELTGCYNRATIVAALEADLERRDGRPERAVVFIDLDGFKVVNDTLGHAAGDELLATVAARLAGAVRDQDLVGRFGGDEFLVICPQVGGLQRATKLAERLALALSGDTRLASGTIALQASVGFTWSDSRTVCADTLVAQADAAMYETKRSRAARPRHRSTLA